MPAPEELIGNGFDWRGFEKMGSVSSDPVTSLAFTAKTTTGGTPILQSGAADSLDPYGNGFGFRTAYSGTGALNSLRSNIFVPGTWKRLFLSCRIRVVTNAMASGKKHELVAFRNSSGNTLFGVQWERTAGGLHFRHFIGHPASSGHPAGATSYTADTNTTSRATNTYFTILLVAEAIYAGGSKLNLTMYVDGSAGNTLNDSAFASAPHNPHVVIPGGRYQIIVGSYGMDNAVNTQNENFDSLRFGYTPPLATAASGLGV